MKKLLVCFLTLCMVFTMLTLLGVSASAAAEVAEVTVGEETNTFQTFADAVTKAQQNEGATLKLLCSVNVEEGLEIGGTYTLDTNGYYIYVKAPLTVSTGTLTIRES